MQCSLSHLVPTLKLSSDPLGSCRRILSLAPSGARLGGVRPFPVWPWWESCCYWPGPGLPTGLNRCRVGRRRPAPCSRCARSVVGKCRRVDPFSAVGRGGGASQAKNHRAVKALLGVWVRPPPAPRQLVPGSALCLRGRCQVEPPV